MKINNNKMFLLIFLILLMFQGVLSAQFKTTEKQNSSTALAGMGNSVKLPSMKDFADKNIEASADSYEYVGSNLIAKGHVVIRNKALRITSDSAVINLKSSDAEFAGNVIFRGEVKETKTVDLYEYRELMKDPASKVTILQMMTTPTGRRKLQVEITTNTAYMQAQRLSGNLDTGHFIFRKFTMKAGMLFLSGEIAERYADGNIKIHKAMTSTCEYLLDSNAHYAIGSKEMLVSPREANRSFFNADGDHGDYSILAKNSFLYLWNVPVFWFPALYKPRDFSSFGGRMEFGKDSDWGWYIRLRKDVDILEKPARVKGSVLLDYYDDRGVGYGTSLDITTPESSTEFFAYAVRDRNPYTLWEDDYGENPGFDATGEPISDAEWLMQKSRLKIPKDRYEFRLSNITFFNPRLTFRGQLDLLSDYNFLEEYFQVRYNKDIQPPTFAALDYQGDDYSLLLQSTFKVNSFDATVERMPELRLDIFRKELFSNIYYQGQTSGGYYKMNWREFDLKRKDYPLWTEAQKKWAERNGYLDELKNYESFRFDTLHAFYYPMRFLDSINFIPRFAARMTAYSRSSSRDIKLDDFYTMVAANSLEGWPPMTTKVQNYDKDGGSEYRFAVEFGAELNTKFYRTWQTPKSAFFQIDGLRHVIIPYANYTFIPSPTVDYARLYYFDDVDQITRQNFFRLGLINRLQTRDDNSQIRQYFSMENYWDFHFFRDFGFNNIGDFTTLLSFTPTEEFSLSSKLVMDVGNNNEHDYEVTRGKSKAGRPGISNKLFNRWETTLTYKFSKDWKVEASYLYSDSYRQRATYSMASTLASAVAMTNFASYFEREQLASLAISFPTYFDDRLKGTASATYDVDDGLFDRVDFTLTRFFHCWYLQLGVGAQFERNDRYKRTWKRYAGAALGLTAMPGAALTTRQEMKASDYDDDPLPPDA